MSRSCIECCAIFEGNLSVPPDLPQTACGECYRKNVSERHLPHNQLEWMEEDSKGIYQDVGPKGGCGCGRWLFGDTCGHERCDMQRRQTSRLCDQPVGAMNKNHKREAESKGATTGLDKKPKTSDHAVDPDHLDEGEGDSDNEDEMDDDVEPDVCEDVVVCDEPVGDLALLPDSVVQSYRRLPCPRMDPARDTLEVFNVATTYALRRVGSDRDVSAVVRIHGVNFRGESVMLSVEGHTSHFYVQCPKTGMSPAVFQSRLEKAIAADRESEKLRLSRHVVKVELVQRANIYYWNNGVRTPFFSVHIQIPKLVPIARRVLEKGFQGMPGCKTYETDVLYVLRFMADFGLTGGGWVEIPTGEWSYTDPPLSHAQHEATCKATSFRCHRQGGRWDTIPAVRELVFDIECKGRRGVFPDAKVDPVIQIGNAVSEYGSSGTKQIIFVLGTCDAIADAVVLPFDHEEDLLMAWAEFVLLFDPDLVMGYNSEMFDIPYLMDRAETLGLEGFPKMTRLRGDRVRLKNTQFQSRAHGTSEMKEITWEGRLLLDVMKAVKRGMEKHGSYTLNAISEHYLGEKKDDVPHTMITPLHEGDSETRARLARYCLKDSLLPLRLYRCLMLFPNMVEMGRCTFIPLQFIYDKGQQVRGVAMLLNKIRELDARLVLPAKDKDPQTGTKFQGATVLHALAGFHKDPVATLDFNSLYPNIMIAHNLCYTTLLAPGAAPQQYGLREGEYETTPLGFTFVQKSKKQGILPKILDELLSARKRAKLDLKTATDPITKAVLDGRQLALKVSANSVYGFTGAQIGKLPCLEISGSVTAIGRGMIEKTKNLVESHFTRANGYEHDAVVVYGDTVATLPQRSTARTDHGHEQDSVMIKFGTNSLPEAMKMAKEAAPWITEQLFRPPNNLAFEKVFFPYLLLGKKRYAG